MLARVRSVANVGLESVEVEVEVDVSEKGFPGFKVVGLATKAVEEARERVKTAIRNSGASFPDKKITVNLAPADLPKEGSAYDLPIAIGILVAEGGPDLSGFSHPARQRRDDKFDLESVSDLSRWLRESYFYGELGLDGSLRHTKGVL